MAQRSLSCLGMTVLHTAAYNNKEDILEFLIIKGAFVDEKDDKGKDFVKLCCKIFFSKTFNSLNTSS